VSSPETNLLTYRYVPEEIAPLLRGPCGPGSTVEAVNELLNELTASIQKEQRAQGKTFVSRTTIEAPQYGGQQLTVFRVVLANPLTTRQILAEILDEQCELARRVIEVEGFAPRFAQLKPELKPCAP
jgi:glutamate decarboxylase